MNKNLLLLKELKRIKKIYKNGGNVMEYLRMKKFDTPEMIHISYDLQAGSYIKFDAYKRSTVTPKNLDTLLEKNDFMKVVDAIINNQPVPYFDEGIEQYD